MSWQIRVMFVLWSTWVLGVAGVTSADWTQFRGPGGLGQSPQTGLPTQWSPNQNLAWKTVHARVRCLESHCVGQSGFCDLLQRVRDG